jgi:hypothetical protein
MIRQCRRYTAVHHSANHSCRATLFQLSWPGYRIGPAFTAFDFVDKFKLGIDYKESAVQVPLFKAFTATKKIEYFNNKYEWSKGSEIQA